MTSFPQLRLYRTNQRPANESGDYVLYWMIAARRTGWNFALQRAVAWCRKLGKPLIVFEPLRCDYPWASDRLHRFILDGMADNARRFSTRPAKYYPYLEPESGAGKGLLAALASRACLVVTDNFPAFFLPRMMVAAGHELTVSLEAVDGNGLLPLRAAERDYPSAFAFRRFLQKELRGHLAEPPAEDPLQSPDLPEPAGLPAGILTRWPPAEKESLEGGPDILAAMPIDHDVGPAPMTGGTLEARRRLTDFLAAGLPRYAAERNEPEADVTSGLSPYLHFGHLSAHEIFCRVTKAEGWSIGDLAPEAKGKRSGWWGMSDNAEAFLDQLITWRELGYNMCAFRDDYDRYDSLPAWVRQTLERHADDPRPYLYSLDDFEAGATHDPLWNAAQLQLVREGLIHNYLRMLWGKKILEWSRSPREALKTMIHLNNKYALDGRDPNSYSGIFWCLGRYDRGWPERPIYGKIRSMSSINTARKVGVKKYLRDYAP